MFLCVREHRPNRNAAHAFVRRLNTKRGPSDCIALRRSALNSGMTSSSYASDEKSSRRMLLRYRARRLRLRRSRR